MGRITLFQLHVSRANRPGRKERVMKAVHTYLGVEAVASPRPLPEELVYNPSKESIDSRYSVLLSLELTCQCKQGAGASGSVVLAGDNDTKEKVAIKKIKKKGLTPTQKARLRREYGIMKKLDHPNWVRLHEVFEDEEEVCLVMEYASCGDLFARIVESPHSRLSEADARPIFAQMAEGLMYLHGLGYVHRDIKPENILLGMNGRVLIADLGFGAMWNTTTLTAAPCGSLYYASPEIIKHDGVYFGPEVDTWSLGATLYAMTCGRLPFAGSDDDIRDLILLGEYSYPFFISQQLRNLINGMMNVDPFKRLKLAEVLRHPWTVGPDKTKTKVGNPRRHSAMQQSTCTLHSSAKALQLFPPDADILYKEIVEQIVVQQSQQAEKETEEKIQTPKKQKEKNEKKAKKDKKTKKKEKKESDHEKGKEKEKKPKAPKKKERLPSIIEEGPLECGSAPDQKGEPSETTTTISKKFQHVLTIKERKKKKRHSILFN